MSSEDRNAVLAGAMRLLASREHSQHELRRKLSQKGHAFELVEDVIRHLSEQGLQSDARFVENLINSRRQRGQGPVRIRQELRQHGISSDIIDTSLEVHDHEWQSWAERVRRKKFGMPVPEDYPARMKQAAFLEYRGFTSQQIQALLKNDVLLDVI